MDAIEQPVVPDDRGTFRGQRNGHGQVSYSVSANTGPQRTATLTIAGQGFTLTQASGCSPTISVAPSPLSFAQGGGPGSSSVAAVTGCTWTATSTQSFLTIAAPPGGNGSGNGSVNYSVAANTGPAQRTATLTIAGQRLHRHASGLHLLDFADVPVVRRRRRHRHCDRHDGRRVYVDGHEQ